jgi:hypothetical protein
MPRSCGHYGAGEVFVIIIVEGNFSRSLASKFPLNVAITNSHLPWRSPRLSLVKNILNPVLNPPRPVHVLPFAGYHIFTHYLLLITHSPHSLHSLPLPHLQVSPGWWMSTTIQRPWFWAHDKFSSTVEHSDRKENRPK